MKPTDLPLITALPVHPPMVQAFFDPATWTVSYVVFDEPGGHAAVVDPVLDFEPSSGKTRTASADALIRFIQAQNLTLSWILETHAHADHLSGAQHIRRVLGGQIAIGQAITQVQHIFKGLFHLEPEFNTQGQQFDHLLHDQEVVHIGKLHVHAIAVPGHTPACMAYVVGQPEHAVVFVGDTLFMPDVGTARCDFPGGDPHVLYQSIQRLLALPAHTRLFMCHDYPPAGRTAQWESTVADQRQHNIHVHEGVTEEAFVHMRRARDATLGMPTLLLPSVQVNIRAGAFPPPEANGVAYLKLPLNVL